MKTNDLKGSRAFPLREAYPFAEKHGLGVEARQIQDLDPTWDRPYRTTVRRGFMFDLLERNQLFQAFKEEHWPYGSTQRGEKEAPQVRQNQGRIRGISRRHQSTTSRI